MSNLEGINIEPGFVHEFDSIESLDKRITTLEFYLTALKNAREHFTKGSSVYHVFVKNANDKNNRREDPKPTSQKEKDCSCPEHHGARDRYHRF